MGDNNWWYNRAGKVAPVSNPGSGVPNYGLTVDLATAPYDGPDEFDAVEATLSRFASASASAGAGAGTAAGVSLAQSGSATVADPTWWDRATGVASKVKDVAGAGLGAVGDLEEWWDDKVLRGIEQPGTTLHKENKAAAEAAGLEGFDKYKAIGGANTAKNVSDFAQLPGVEQIFWGLEKVNEYASTLMVASSLAEDDFGLLFQTGTWGDANSLTNERHLNAGEAFMQMFYDKEVLQDEDRFDKIRQHNTAFNVGALTFNVVAAWKADPNVLIGKGVGAARDAAVGRLGTSARSAEVQRDILSAPDLEAAKAKVEGYTGVADKLRALHSVSLYDRASQLREAAKTMGFEDFKAQPAFRNSASGATMAKLMQDVAPSDTAWNLVFRTSIGDPDAIGELIAQRADLADKIAAIELKTMPALERDLTRMETRYQKRLAEQGRPQDARIEITRIGDYWMDEDLTVLRADADALKGRLAAYEDHESWLKRALPGLDVDSGVVGRNAPNSIYGNLDRLGGEGVIRRTLPSMGGAVKMWQKDDYSPVSRAFRAPTKPFLKRVGVVSLNDVDEGVSALSGYLDQLDYIRKGQGDQNLRNRILSSFAGATTDMERKAVVEQVEREAIAALGVRHGLSPQMMDRLGKELQKKRKDSWTKLSSAAQYSPITGKSGPGWVDVTDDAGNAIDRIKMPLEASQLSNWHSMTNLTDLDRTIRQNLDMLRSFDSELVSLPRALASKGHRHAQDFSDYVGGTFNSFWKPMALLSIRWPARVVADESMRVMLLTGAMAHMAHMGEGARNALHNVGVVRPFEWWSGRKIKTGSLSQDSLRAGSRNDFDAYDYRAITNPTGAVPLDEVDLGKLDSKRWDSINAKVAERERYLRRDEASRAQTREAGKTSDRMAQAVSAFTEPAKPGWVRQWDERLADVEASPERGFFFDPATSKMSKKGFAVSVYPGRLRTFDRKPTARELNYWTQKNSDLLGVPTNRTAVWMDKDTGRWHLDVVKTTKRREDAMLLASRAEATEFYDIEDGFTRFMSEDFYEHFNSPFVKPTVKDAPGGVASDQAQLTDEAGAAIGAGMSGVGPIKKKVGFGQRRWRTKDGRTVVGEDVFGADTKNPNIYYGVVSSREAMQNLYGGYTKGLGIDRHSRTANDYRVFDPDNPEELEDWAVAYADFANNHIRYSPLSRQMLDGKTDDEIYEWLIGTPEGRELRGRIPVRGENPHQWVTDVRSVFDHMFPTERALEAARLGEIDPKQALDLVPEGLRGTMHGDAMKLGLGTSPTLHKVGAVVNKLMEYLGSVPTDALVRHPFAATVYRREMANYLRTVPSDKATNNVLAAAEASARAKAIREVRRTLYNIADEREGVHMLRFVSPFFQAQVEVLERYARISMEKPETVARLAQILIGSQTINTGLWEVQDRDGNKVDGYDGDNQVIFQVTPTLRKLADKIPGLKGALDEAGDVAVPVASLNLVLQGDMPFLPSLGPLVTYPASELYFTDRPDLEGTALYKWAYPFGTPKGEGFGERLANSILPAYARRGLTERTADMSDPAFVRRVSEIASSQMIRWENGGREGERPTEKDALEAAKAEYRLRTFSSFFLPAPVAPRSPYQGFVDLYRQYQAKFGIEADEKFYDEVGPDFYLFAQRATEASGGVGPNIGEAQAYRSYKSLIEKAPDLAGVLTGPFATPEFSDSVYQWQLRTPVSPASDTMLRERLSPAERIAEAESGRGWVEYGKLASAIDAELRVRQAAGGSPYLTASSNADLSNIRSEKILEIIERNPAWQDAYNSRTSRLGGWLEQAYTVSFEGALDGRPDIEALRAYLIGRARLQDALIDRARNMYATTGARTSDQLSYDPLGNPVGDNADLATAWQSWVGELKASNPMFAEIYNRYLEGDDLSTYIPAEVSGG